MPGAHSYVVRPADDELFESIQDGHYSYVLTSRQMGKSSLMHRTARRLQEAGITPVLLDLTSIGANLSIEQWYFGLVAEIGHQLSVKDEMDCYWTENERHGPLYRFTHAISEIGLTHVEGPLAIFIDEIDFIRGLKFSTDEFFAAIRHCYNNRATDPVMRRLTFCLLGVATPADLIRDAHTTPFNIGRQIELSDFSRNEAAQLESGLSVDPERARKMLDRIMYWTGGHPYLTQKLCLAISQDPDIAVNVDYLCHELFLTSRRRMSEDNLIFVHNTLKTGGSDPAVVINRYRRVLAGKPVANDPADPVVAQLRLAGVVKVSDGRLRVRNTIYRRVFNAKWVDENLPDADVRRERAAFRRGLLTAVAIAVGIVAVLVVFAYTTIKAEQHARSAEMKLSRDLSESNYQRSLDDIMLAQRALEENNAARADQLLTDCVHASHGSMASRFEFRYLWHICHSEIATLTGCAGPVLAVRALPGGHTIAAVDDRGNSFLWNIKTTKLVASIHLAIPPLQCFSARFDKLGNLVAISCSDNYVYLFKSKTGQPVGRFYRLFPAYCSFSGDGNWLITGDNSGTVEPWNLRTNTGSIILKRKRDQVTSLNITGTKIVAGYYSGALMTATCLNRTPSRILSRLSNEVTAVAISGDGLNIVAGTEQGDIEYIRIRTDVSYIALTPRWKRGINDICLHNSPNGLVAAVARQDGVTEIWNILRRSCTATLIGHQLDVGTCDFGERTGIIVTGSVDHSVKIWDVGRIDSIRTISTGLSICSGIQFINQERYLIAYYNTNQRATLSALRLSDLQTAWRMQFDDGISISSASDHVVVVEANGQVKHYAASGSIIDQFRIPAPAKNFDTSISANGQILSLLIGETRCQLLDVAHKKMISELPQLSGRIVFCKSSIDGSRIAAGAVDNSVTIWDVISARELQTVIRGTCCPAQAEFSPDGSRISILWSNGIMTEHNILTGVIIRSIDTGHWCTGFARTKDGATVAFITPAGDLKFWDIKNNIEVLSIHLQPGLSQITFSENGVYLAASSKRGDITILKSSI